MKSKAVSTYAHESLLLVGVGAGMGLVDWALAFYGPTIAPGLPGGGGPGLLQYLIVYMSLVGLVPSLLAIVRGPSRPLGRRGQWFLWNVGLLPSFLLISDQLAFSRHWFGWRANAGLGEEVLRALVVALVAMVLLLAQRLRMGAQLGPVWRAPHGAPHILVLLLALGLATAFPFPERAPSDTLPPASAPDILLLSVDTLRQDALGSYGGVAAASMDSLIRSGVRLDGWAPSPWTLPSFASLFSGIAPSGHGAAFRRAPDPSIPWWPEELASAGWQTAAILSNPYLAQRFGMDRGFLRHDHSGRLERLDPIGQSFVAEFLHRRWERHYEHWSGPAMVGRAAKWLKNTPEDRPFLLWLHLLDPHLPYRAHGIPFPALASKMEGDAFRELLGLRDGIVELDDEERQNLRSLYDGEVQYVDRQIGEFLARLRESREGRGRPLYWILMSDHGEEFFEHGGFEHGHSLHQEVLRVPLAMGGLGLTPGSFGGAMGLGDIGPTLRGLSGLKPVEAPALDPSLRAWVEGQDLGHQLGRALPDSGQRAIRTMIAENLLYGPPRTRWQDAAGAMAIMPEDGGTIRFHDLLADPEEFMPFQRPLGEWESHRLERLASWREQMKDIGEPINADALSEEQLRALGYIQ